MYAQYRTTLNGNRPDNLKFSYFNLTGRGEPIRYLFAQAGMEYEDNRIEFSDWPGIKSSTPNGTMPMLEVTFGNKTDTIGTSLAVARYVATITGLYGSSAVEKSVIDSIVDVANDIREDAVSGFMFKKDETEKAEGMKAYREKADTKLTNLTKIFQGPKYFMGGEEPTFADIHFLGCAEMVMGKGVPDLLGDHPVMKELYNRVLELPNIQAWKQKHPRALKFWYFNGKGRGEPIRYLFAHANVEYEDHRIEFKDWPSVKPTMPGGTMPMLEVTVGDKTEQIGSSLAIARYVAWMTGVYGCDPVEQSVIDSIVDVANDIREEAISMFVFEKDETKKAEGIKAYREKADVKLTNLTKIFKGPKFFMGGEQPTWADIHYMGCMEMVLLNADDILAGHRVMKELYSRVQGLPNIQKWIQTRPKSEM